MPTKPKINVRLLRRIQKQIAKEPRQFAMSGWYTHHISGVRIPNCETAACIGGWARAISKSINPQEADNPWCDVKSEAQDLLGLTEDQSDRLFLKHHWPFEFWFSRCEEGTPAAARLAIRRIDHFIKSKGAE